MTEDKQGIFPTVWKLFTNSPEEVAGAAVAMYMAKYCCVVSLEHF